MDRTRNFMHVKPTFFIIKTVTLNGNHLINWLKDGLDDQHHALNHCSFLPISSMVLGYLDDIEIQFRYIASSIALAQ